MRPGIQSTRSDPVAPLLLRARNRGFRVDQQTLRIDHHPDHATWTLTTAALMVTDTGRSARCGGKIIRSATVERGRFGE